MNWNAQYNTKILYNNVWLKYIKINDSILQNKNYPDLHKKKCELKISKKWFYFEENTLIILQIYFSNLKFRKTTS